MKSKLKKSQILDTYDFRRERGQIRKIMATSWEEGSEPTFLPHLP
jgi:hypothetical protein